jgi:hypothetical protein
MALKKLPLLTSDLEFDWKSEIATEFDAVNHSNFWVGACGGRSVVRWSFRRR